MAAFKFAKVKNGIGRFAAIDLDFADGAPGSIVWAESLPFYSKREYGDAVTAGIHDALGWHSETGGTPTAFLVRDLQELITDTSPDAVRCAAAGAAWLLLGHRAEELVFEWDGEREGFWKAFCIR